MKRARSTSERRIICSSTMPPRNPRRLSSSSSSSRGNNVEWNKSPLSVVSCRHNALVRGGADQYTWSMSSRRQHWLCWLRCVADSFMSSRQTRPTTHREWTQPHATFRYQRCALKTTLYTVFQKKTPCTHIVGYKLRNSCLILIIFDTKIPDIIWHHVTA